ncbi:MAG: AAA-like domain-containing protein [Fibromonadaceae bacterium]|jgi:hypothetical protein|nr:AAA-like domain-containing protein [Fibromonadaceae bacterium]
MREFNVTGICLPKEHYMVDITNKVNQIAAMVEKGKYFTINRARQYGKTTTIRQLEKFLLGKGYQVARISFEGIGDEPFENEKNFCQTLLRQISDALKYKEVEDYNTWINESVFTFENLKLYLNNVCQKKRVVLIIDETDKTSNNLVFLRFLGMLRDKYLERENPSKATFQSVILAGVYDIKNLKLKMIQAGTHQLQDGEKRMNSPWNIAVNFEVDMSFSASEIATMLNEYEKDHKTGMDIEAVSKEIRAYTSGYPYLVSRICQIIDEKLGKTWTEKGVQEAVKLILCENSTLFDDINQNLENNENLRNLVYNIIIQGEKYPFKIASPEVNLGVMFGVLSNKNNIIAIDNEIFENHICDYFISQSYSIKGGLSSRVGIAPDVVENGKFNMELAIKKFAQHYYEIYNGKNAKFLENECRLLFLTYLRPLINGAGFFHIESETRDNKRTDLIVDYSSEQFIIELKLWHGEQKHEQAHKQLIEYLNSKNKSIGYLLTFDFRKNRAKKPSAKWVKKGKKKFLDCLAV